jgi:uncharacterized alkaline shock family protein YloU
VERQEHVLATSELGRIAVSGDAIAQLVATAAAESYGVVGLAGRRRLLGLPWGRDRAVRVELREDGLAVDVHVVVEHGLRLAEVGARARERISYELERMLGLPLASLEVHIDRVRSR